MPAATAAVVDVPEAPQRKPLGKKKLLAIVAAAALAVVITWLLVGFAFDSGATRAPQNTSLTDAATTTAIRSLEPGQWPGPPPYPPGFRGMP